ncbi:hypothetical protein, conserved [Eimeria praecox]|uniref:SET domain-containing protein n=1 Tax=Eimeria praecox TaxID=51316 RepID=U6GRY0_9EIME|nr:hypothetical protein, conserved [Eimeria praecox]
MGRPSLLSVAESTALINNYCAEHHQGKLVCTLDPLKGRTLRANRSFQVGELILQEPPLHAVRLDLDNLVCTKLIRLCEEHAFTHPAIWYWCALNSVLVEGRDRPVDGLQAISRRQYDLLRILFIPDAVKPSSEAVTLVDCMGLRGVVEDIDMEIMIQVWLHNCFEHHQSPEGYAIYFMPSFCSHSCLPNALWCTDNDSNFRFFPRATIRAGDEVTLTYLSEDDMLRNTTHRRQLLEGAKDFKCMCESADEAGTEEGFDGALLKVQEEAAPIPEDQRFIPASRSTSDSPIPDERAPDTWRQTPAPQHLYPETARGSAERYSQRKRALAIERLLEDVFNSLERHEAELRDGLEQSPASSLSSGAGGPDRESHDIGNNSNESDEGAHELLQRLEVHELLCIVKRKWHLLEKKERRVLDATIKLTFSTHWLAAQWYRFLESVSSPRRKLLHLDRLIWQYRNLYPGLTPALAWAIWDVAQALFSLGENSRLRKSISFRRFADHCIVSSYYESVFILTILFGADGSFPVSIVSNYSDAVSECLERVNCESGLHFVY